MSAKTTLLILIVSGLLSCGSKQEQPASANRPKPANETEANIYRSSDSMLAAYERRDYLSFARYSNPRLIKVHGGAANYANFVQEQMKQIPDTAIKQLSTGKVLQVVKTETDQQCVIEQNMVMELDGIRIERTSYLIGESLDDGKSWTFFDASNGGMTTPKDIKPNLSPQIKIPPKKQEVSDVRVAPSS